MKKVTAILNGYKRPDNLKRQLEAIKNQTVESDVMLWYNNPGDDTSINYDISSEVPAAYCNHNFGVWARFYFALNAKTEYVCVFDDDTIPGNRWFESCIHHTENGYEGLMGTIGLLYQGSAQSYYEPYASIGWKQWPDGVNYPIKVDFVGHAWFFKRSWLSIMFSELPDPSYTTCGEDMHFSYMLQKFGIPTYVPPHPTHDMSIWGSIDGARLGADAASLWESNATDENNRPFKSVMNQFFIEQRKKGWKLINE